MVDGGLLRLTAVIHRGAWTVLERTLIDPNLERALIQRIQRIPIVETLKIHIDACDEGYCKATSPYDSRFDGVFESLHGGILMTLADSIACFAIMTKTGPEEPLTTTDMNIRFLAPCLTDVTIVAQVVKFGRTLCPVTVDLFDANETKVAFAQVTYIRLKKIPSRSRQ